MPNYQVPEWLRACGIAYLYWVAFLLALEPGNILRAQSLGHDLAFDREALRIGVAALLGSSTAPLIMALNRRHPVFGAGGWRNVAIHAASAALLSFVLILISCVLAAWILMAKPLPAMPEIRGQLAANWLLLTFVLIAFAVLSQAIRRTRAPSRRHASPSGNTIAVKTRGRLGFVEVARIEWIEAQGNYLALHVGGASHLVRETLQSFATRLDPKRFVRVHRRMIVAVDRIREIQPLANGDSTLILQDGHAIRASRGYRETIRARWAQAMAGGSAAH
jgi:hypothetical protein